jgi:hypothetical protein
MEFKNEELKTRFVIPEPVSVKKMMAYMSVSATSREVDLIDNMWRAALEVITEWESPYLPNRYTDLEQETNPAVYDVILWVGTEVRRYIHSLERIPKN